MIEFQALETLWCSIEMTIGVPFEARSNEDLKELNDRWARGRRRKLLQEAYPELEDEMRANLAQLPEKEAQRKYLLEIREKLAEAEPFLEKAAQVRAEIAKDRGPGGVVDWAEAMIYRAALPSNADLVSIGKSFTILNPWRHFTPLLGSKKPLGILKAGEAERLHLCYLNMIALGADTCLRHAIDNVDRQLRHIVAQHGATPFTVEEAEYPSDDNADLLAVRALQEQEQQALEVEYPIVFYKGFDSSKCNQLACELGLTDAKDKLKSGTTIAAIAGMVCLLKYEGYCRDQQQTISALMGRYGKPYEKKYSPDRNPETQRLPQEFTRVVVEASKHIERIGGNKLKRQYSPDSESWYKAKRR